LTPEQRDLARHALGLPNSKRKSYRNRFFTGRGGPHHLDWSAMVSAGDAERGEDGRSTRCFHLTRQGAEAALNAGESLDREDFPTTERTAA